MVIGVIRFGVIMLEMKLRWIIIMMLVIRMMMVVM